MPHCRFTATIYLLSPHLLYPPPLPSPKPHNINTQKLIEDVPIDVKIQLERSEHLINKCVRLIDDPVELDEVKLRLMILSGKIGEYRNALVSNTVQNTQQAAKAAMGLTVGAGTAAVGATMGTGKVAMGATVGTGKVAVGATMGAGRLAKGATIGAGGVAMGVAMGAGGVAKGATKGAGSAIGIGDVTDQVVDMVDLENLIFKRNVREEIDA